MILKYNYFEELEEPEYILCKPSGDKIGAIQCTKKTFQKKYNDYNQISFTTYMMYDNQKNDIYHHISEMQCVEVPAIGRFIIQRVDINGESSDLEYKQCTALSEEITMAQKYLELFYINLGTTGSIDGVSLYNLSDPDKSLLHLVLEKCPDWTIGHVDTSLYTVQRSFEVSRQDVYSFLVNDIAAAFACIFDFDTLNHKINVYEEDRGMDTEIIVSYDNLLKNVSISSSIDDIKTCLTITGSEDLSIREVNMGYDRIYMLDYFHSLEYMSESLYHSYTAWKQKWNENVDLYQDLITEYQQYYNQLNYLRSKKMPDHSDSTDWTEYGLVPLQEKLAVYEQKQDVMIKAGQANKEHSDYKTVYLPCYNTIQEIKKQIEIVEEEIAQLKERQMNLSAQMNAIIETVSMQNNFSQAELSELTKFIREDELSSTNFVVTDTMTESERMDMLHELLDYGKKELAKVAQPTLSFSADIANLYNIPEFAGYQGDFDTGNYIHVILRDDYIIKAKILTVAFDFMENTISPTFGSISKPRIDGILSDVTEAVSLAQSAASTVSFNSSYWNIANKEATSISKMLSEGLLAAGQSLKTAHSDLIIDDRGVFVNNTEDAQHVNDGIFIGGGQILFTDDAFESVKTALGRVSYQKKGVAYEDFGLLAQFVISGYIAGTIIEGNEIIGGTITGSEFNNGNGTFSVDAEGNLTATSGTIGGWTITENKLYAGDTENGEKVAVIQKPRDGITWVFAAGGSNHSSYVDCPFRVSKDGKLYATDATIEGTVTATSGKFGGINIESNKIYSDNNKFVITSDGYATLKDVTVTGVHTGSSFGGITYSSNGTSANLNNGFSAGKSFGLSGGARTDFDNLVASTVTADYIEARVHLSATTANITNLSSRVASIEDVVAGTVVANNLKVKAANISGNITANSISLTDDSGQIVQIAEPIDILAISAYNMTTGAIIETKKVRLFGLVIPDYASGA